MEGIMTWDSSGVENISSFESTERLFEKPDCLSETSRSSGLLVTVPELMRDIAPVRYGLFAEEFYKSDTNSETVRNIGNEQRVPSSSSSKLFLNHDGNDEVLPVSSQCESFHMKDKLPGNSAKSIRIENPYTLLSTIFEKEADASEGYSKTSKIREVPIWKPTSNLFRDTKRGHPRNDPSFSGREVHRIIFSPVLERGPFNCKNEVSTTSLAYRRIPGTSTLFDRFRYQRIPRATARRFLINRDPKYKAKYG
uniref:Shugoshin_C domain-containing protein n=1 Tax=Elaeophora elaphi TaxID=1147741 RepID=A0A0R3RHJ6_9BILA